MHSWSHNISYGQVFKITVNLVVFKISEKLVSALICKQQCILITLDQLPIFFLQTIQSNTFTLYYGVSGQSVSESYGNSISF